MVLKQIQEAAALQEPSCGGPEVDNRLLLQRAMNDKEAGALAVLYARYYRRLVCYIATRSSAAAEAEDWAQDVFVRIWETNAQYEIGESVEAYLFALANRIIAWHMRQRWRRRHQMLVDPVANSVVTRTVPVDQDRTDWVASVLSHPYVRNARTQLSSKSQEAIRLRFVQGLSVPEAARRAGCSVPAFYSRLERALRSLRQAEYENQ